jgi:HlyD family secretion protein
MARSRSRWIKAAGVVALVAIGGAVAWSRLQKPELPDGFASGNGRLEATEVVIATKRPGRTLEVLVEEGDAVESGQIVARIAAEDLEAERRNAEARLQAAREEHNRAEAVVAQRDTELALAAKEFERTAELSRRGLVATQTFDEDHTRKQMAAAALQAARAQTLLAQASIQAAAAQVERVKADLADTVLTSPVSGRVLYRLAEPGEVLPAGGRLLTVLDLSDVYMIIFLPMRDASRAPIGAEARIVLDAQPEIAIPGTLTFVAPVAQFTPKEVETRNEREKLMFRAKVRVDPKALDGRLASVKTGLPGMAYIRIDATGGWPAPLAPRPAP